MTLDELLYQIEGRLVQERNADPGQRSKFRVKLLDNVGDVVSVRVIRSLHGSEVNAFCDAVMEGDTLEEALDKLAVLLRGNVLIYNMPIMWTEFSTSIRIPKTLIPGNPESLLPRVGSEVFALVGYDISTYVVTRHENGAIYGVCGEDSPEVCLGKYWVHKDDIPPRFFGASA